MQRADDALNAAEAIRLYLDQPSPGQWRDSISASGDVMPGPSPAASALSPQRRLPHAGQPGAAHP